MYYLYLLKNQKGKIYYGYTSDLKKRVKQHNSSKSRYTSGNKWKIVYYEAYFSERDAKNREKQLKKHGQALAQLKRRIKASMEKVSAE